MKQATEVTVLSTQRKFFQDYCVKNEIHFMVDFENEHYARIIVEATGNDCYWLGFKMAENLHAEVRQFMSKELLN